MDAAGDRDGSGRWTPRQLAQVERSPELEVAVRRSDGTLTRWTPIWAVVVGEDVYVRTWQRRETGWYGGALRNGTARIRVPGAETEVGVESVVRTCRAAVDGAYEAKYGGAGARTMITEEAAASTLRLVPAGA
jgi:hypothetical protein